MAYPNKVIKNKVTGQDITFIHTAADTQGQLLEMMATYRPGSTEPPAHYHPRQDEDFEVVFGEIKIRLNDAVHTLHKGEHIHIPRNQVHSMWNGSSEPTLVNWKVRPAYDTEFLMETITGLANDDKTNAKGTPSLLQTSLTGTHFSNSIRFASPPYLVQRILFTLLAPVAWLTGLRATYTKYLR